jgi:hypothetical protein
MDARMKIMNINFNTGYKAPARHKSIIFLPLLSNKHDK